MWTPIGKIVYQKYSPSDTQAFRIRQANDASYRFAETTPVGCDCECNVNAPTAAETTSSGTSHNIRRASAFLNAKT